MTDIDALERVKALLDLYKQQMEHFRSTQEIEWKGNFGVWTLLAGAIYLVTNKPISINFWWAALLLIVVAVAHIFWLFKMHFSEVFDKELWTRYRAEALVLIRGADLMDGERPWKRSWAQEFFWLLSEVAVTLLLCGFLFFKLVRH